MIVSFIQQFNMKKKGKGTKELKKLWPQHRFSHEGLAVRLLSVSRLTAPSGSQLILLPRSFHCKL